MAITIRATYVAEYRGSEDRHVEAQLEGSIRKTHSRGVVYDHFPNKPARFDMSARFDTDAEGAAFIALFPKFCNVVPNRSVRPNETTIVRLKSSISFSADGANKGANETGIKRVRKIIEICRASGIEIKMDDMALNTYSDLDAFLAAL